MTKKIITTKENKYVKKQKMDARQAAFQAVIEFEKTGHFLSNTLDKWITEQSPSEREARLAKELAFGVVRLKRRLDQVASQFFHKKTKLKRIQLWILRLSLYQRYFMDKIPLYAIASSMIPLAKKHSHIGFSKMLNGILRKSEDFEPIQPKNESNEDLANSYSFPDIFVNSLVDEHGFHKAAQILETLNHPSEVTARFRGDDTSSLDLLDNSELPMVALGNSDKIQSVAKDSDYYIQNITQVKLLTQLTKSLPAPNSILDLCSAPGGKAILAHDLYPQASLTLNDCSKQRIKTLEANLKKYGIHATVSSHPGQSFSSDKKFDLIILDVPCSNSGVLHKRPEARWRITKEYLDEICELQAALLKTAVENLAPGGQIWYLTCSILKCENEQQIELACKQYGLSPAVEPTTVYPSMPYSDGGFACSLTI